MSKLITAKEADELDPAKEDDRIDEYLNDLIKKNAAKREFRTYGPASVFGGTELYCGSDKYPDVVKRTLKRLTDAGYTARICCEENQFVDIYLLVEWE